MADGEGWSIQNSSALYGLDRWGEPYFAINGRGHISVQPQGERGGSLALVDLVSELRGRNLGLSLLNCFGDVLERLSKVGMSEGSAHVLREPVSPEVGNRL